MRLDPLPQELLETRSDEDWEHDWDDRQDERISAAVKYAKTVLSELFVIQHLGGQESDDEFMDIVDDLYNEIKNALTRQELVRAFLSVLAPKAKERSKRIISRMERDMVGVDLLPEQFKASGNKRV